MNERRRVVLALSALIAVTLALPPDRAAAYLMDANDASTLDPGTLEMELQPVGYFWFNDGSGDYHSLVAPSLMIYLGLADGADFIFLSRGFFLAAEVFPTEPEAEDPMMPPEPMEPGDEVQEEEAPSPLYRTWESTVALRFLLVQGRYSTEDVEGPSLVVQVGAMLPNVNGPGERPGAQIGLLLAEQGDFGTLHANAWATYTTWQSFDAFFAVAMEGPPDWQVRPLVEVWYDHDTFYGNLLSGLIGFYADTTDHLTFEIGARAGGWEGYAEAEVRLSMWLGFPPLWETHETHDEDCRSHGDSGPDPGSHRCPTRDDEGEGDEEARGDGAPRLHARRQSLSRRM